MVPGNTPFDNHGLALLSLYPNPADVNRNIRINYFTSSRQETEIKIYDLSGTLAKELILAGQGEGSHLLEISTLDLQKGSYILKINQCSRRFELK